MLCLKRTKRLTNGMRQAEARIHIRHNCEVTTAHHNHVRENVFQKGLRARLATKDREHRLGVAMTDPIALSFTEANSMHETEASRSDLP